MKKLTKSQITYLVLGFLSAFLFILIRKQLLEIVTSFIVGMLIGSVFDKKQKLIFIVTIGIWFIAIIFDPIIKPILDFIFKLNTVGYPFSSFIINTSLLLSFWVGFFLGKKYH